MEDLKEEPTTLLEHDFDDSDFNFATFPSDRVVVLSYMLGLPEVFNLWAQISKYGDGSDGVFGIIEFDCDAFNAETPKAAIPRFWVFDGRAFGTPPATSRFNENTSAASCQSMLQTWLSQCNSHDTCVPQRQSFLPTRLLDLGDVEVKGKISLVLSANLDQSTRYVTLSHCWGGKVPVQLTEDTKADMFKGFDLDVMPETFRDAIAVARWVNVRYIWIDSCCIQQDSPSDWQREAKMMQKVYKNTYLNISADHSENSRGGCFIDRLAYKMTPCPFVAPDVGEVFFVPRFDIMKPLTDSPIASRAWVTQERFLSPRILHFTTDQLFWECACIYACETFPHGVPHVYDNSTSWPYRAPSVLTQIDHQIRPTHHQAWRQICEDYSHSRLSFISDRIIAFAGIADEFQLRLPNDTYLAGLWKNDLIAGLLWKPRAIDGWPTRPNESNVQYADPYLTASMPTKYRAPSWSWLGKDVGICWTKYQIYSPNELIKVEDVFIDLIDPNEPAGDVKGGYITLRGLLRAAQWSQNGYINSIILDGKTGDQLFVAPDNASDSHPASRTTMRRSALQHDTGYSFPTPHISCLPVRISLSPNNEPFIEGLILGTTGEEGRYERLGQFEAVGEGYARALFYELKEAARELERPWEALGLEDGHAEGYDAGLFRKLEESVITII